MINEINEKENGEKVEVYRNNAWIIIKIGKFTYSCLGKRESDILKRLEGYRKVDITYTTIWRRKDDTVIITDYYDIYIRNRKFFLHIDDGGHPIYTYACEFRLTPEAVKELLAYTLTAPEIRIYSS